MRDRGGRPDEDIDTKKQNILTTRCQSHVAAPVTDPTQATQNRKEKTK